MSLVASQNTHCYVCGPENPQGLRVSYEPEGELGSVAHYTARAEHTGWQGILHGGVAFALLDEGFGKALYFQNLAAVTAKIEMRFVQPIAVGTQLVVHAKITAQRQRLFFGHAEIRSDGPDNTLFASAEATMMLVKEKTPVAAAV